MPKSFSVYNHQRNNDYKKSLKFQLPNQDQTIIYEQVSLFLFNSLITYPYSFL